MSIEDVIEWERGLAQTRHEDRLNLIENEAQRCIAIQEMYGVQFPSEQMAGDLARAVLAMLPVVRAANEWHGWRGSDDVTSEGAAAEELWASIDEMRRAMEGR